MKRASRTRSPRSYQARVVLDEPADTPLLPGTRGRAKITVEPQSLAQRLYRFLQQMFNLS